MKIKTNLIDLNKITLENYATFNERIEYEITKLSMIKRNITNPKEKIISAEERKQHIKEYQHNYYLTVTKIKRKLTEEESYDK